MHIVGELNDGRMAHEILEEYKSREIVGHYFFDNALGAHVIAVENDEHLPIAIDIYRVKLGFKKPTEIDPEWIKIKSIPKGKWTLKIVIFCIIIFVFSYFPWGKGLYQIFQIDSHENGFLVDITHGQLWRFITPIFLHMGIFHILFNMLWFLDLGSIFEYKFSWQKFAAFILVSALISNLFQYVFMGPSFGGMSGVLYGMLSYFWINKKLMPDFEFSLPKHDIFLMIAWFFLCLFGIFPHVANYAHAGGIAVGIWWASFQNFKLELQRIKYIGYGVFVVLITVLVEKFNWHF